MPSSACSERLLRLALCAGLLLRAGPLEAGFKFGLGKAAAQRSAELFEKAARARTSASAASSATVSSRRKWAYIGETLTYSSPAIGADGTVYFGTSDHFQYYNGYWLLAQKPPAKAYGLYAYNPDGTLKWKYSDGTDAAARGSPAIAPDGTVYIVFERLGTSKETTTEELHAVTSAGAQKWKVTVSTVYAEVGALSPAVAGDGTVYVTARDFTAYNPADGSVKWRRYGSQSVTSVYFGSPAIGADGAVYTVHWSTYGVYGQVVRAYNADGSERWSSPDLGTYPISCSPTLAPGGTVYIGIRDTVGLVPGGDAALVAIASTATIRWAFDAGDFQVRSAPSIDADGTIYFGTKGNNGYVYALKADGTQKWRYRTADEAGGAGTDVYNSPAIGADGTIYAYGEFGYLYAFQPDGALLWKDPDLAPGNGSGGWSSAAIAADGTLYVGTLYGAMLAVTTSSLGLKAGAPWPRFHRTNDNAGRE